jgi:hypothetical protein
MENQNSFQTNLNIHGINTRNRNQLHLPSASLSYFQKGVFYSGIRNLRNDKIQSKKEVQKYLITHSFYSVTKFLELNINGDDI